MFAAAIATMFVSFAADPAPVPPREVSCAAASLYALMQFEGAAAELDDVRRRLPLNDTGNSIGEIMETSRELGFRVVARQADKRLPERPFIALQRPNGPTQQTVGHFTAVRPIDTAGAQYQVVDPGKEPYVVEEQQILDDERYSGIVIVKKSPLPLLISILLLAVGAIGLVTSAVLYQRIRTLNGGKQAIT